MELVFFCFRVQSHFLELLQHFFDVAPVLHDIVGVNYPRRSENTSFMKRWKAAGALVSPNGITDHSKAP